MKGRQKGNRKAVKGGQGAAVGESLGGRNAPSWAPTGGNHSATEEMACRWSGQGWIISLVRQRTELGADRALEDDFEVLGCFLRAPV